MYVCILYKTSLAACTLLAYSINPIKNEDEAHIRLNEEHCSSLANSGGAGGVKNTAI